MEIKIIPLAAKKIKLRKITTSMLNETVKSPDQVFESYGNRTIKQKIYNINNKKKLLRVICEAEGKNTIVITAYLTSQVKKYWKPK